MAIRSKKSHASRLMIETLEGREVPASLVTGVIAGGVLTLTGTDEADTFTIQDTGPDVIVSGTGATSIKNGATTVAPGAPTTFAGVTGIKLVLKGGNDIVSQFVPVTGAYALNLTGVFSADMGDGNNSLTLDDSTDQSAAISLASFDYKGGEGSDLVSIGNTLNATPALSTITGKVTFDGGVGTGTLTLNNVTADSVDFKGDEGDDTLSLNTSTVTKNVTADFGYGQDDSGDRGQIFLNATTVTGNVSAKGIGGSNGSGAGVRVNTSGVTAVQGATGISIDGGANGDSSLNASGTLTVAGGITVKGMDGSSSVNTASVTVGKTISVTNSSASANLTGVGAITVGPVKVAGVSSASATIGTSTFATTVNGAVTVSASQGSSSLTINGKTADLKGAVSVTGTFGATINDIVNDPAAAPAVGASHYFAGVSAKSSVRAARFNKPSGDGTLTVDGAVSLSGPQGAGVNIFGSAGDSNFKKGVSATSSLDVAYFDVSAGKTTVTGNVSLTGYYTDLGLNSSGVAGHSVTGNVTLTGKAGSDFVDIFGATIGGNATFNLSNGDAFVNIGSVTVMAVPVKTTFAKNLSITTGAGVDSVSIDGATVAGTAAIKTGSGADTVSIDNATFSKTFMLDTAGGDDVLNIARNNDGLPVTFTGKATIKLGDGNDTMAIGDTTGDIAAFGAGSTADGGTGYNLYDPQAGQGPILTLAVSTNFTDLTP